MSRNYYVVVYAYENAVSYDDMLVSYSTKVARDQRLDSDPNAEAISARDARKYFDLTRSWDSDFDVYYSRKPNTI